jgi:hypothetical protein
VDEPARSAKEQYGFIPSNGNNGKTQNREPVNLRFGFSGFVFPFDQYP